MTKRLYDVLAFSLCVKPPVTQYTMKHNAIISKPDKKKLSKEQKNIHTFLFLFLGCFLFKINKSFIFSKLISEENKINNTLHLKDSSRIMDQKDEKSGSQIPKGGIIMFSGEKIPEGWQLCNGQNGAPDLRGRFVLGLGQGEDLTNRTLNSVGGEEKHTLSLSEMPPHTHNNPYNGIGDRMHPSANGYNTTSTGTAQPHNIMPPFYVLAFLMKL